MEIDKLNLLNCSNALELSKFDGQVRVGSAGKRAAGWSDSDLLFDNWIVEELAVIFRITPQTVFLAVQGQLPYIKVGRKNLFLVMRSLQKWLNRKEKPQWQ